MKRCQFSNEWVEDDAAVLVGEIPRTSGPDVQVHACHMCVDVLDILPLAEHPADSDGLPRYRDGRHVDVDRGEVPA